MLAAVLPRLCAVECGLLCGAQLQPVCGLVGRLAGYWARAAPHMMATMLAVAARYGCHIVRAWAYGCGTRGEAPCMPAEYSFPTSTSHYVRGSVVFARVSGLRCVAPLGGI